MLPVGRLHHLVMMQKFPDKAGKRVINFQSVCPDFSEEAEGCPLGQKLALLPLNFRCHIKEEKLLFCITGDDGQEMKSLEILINLFIMANILFLVIIVNFV